MKKQLIFAAILSTTLMVAQNSNQNPPAAKEAKQATVRIKKVENINGVERITDTTYTTDDPSMLKYEGMHFDEKNMHNSKQVIIIDDENDPKRTDAEREKEVNKIMQELNEKGTSNIEKDSKNKKGQTCYSKTVTVKISLEDPNEKELKKIAKENGETDGKLKVEELRFFPSPSNGQSVNLSFELAEKGDAVVNVLDMEGMVSPVPCGVV